MNRIASLNVKIFADTADLASIVKVAANPWIKGFTTNPSLMAKAGVTDYEAFARKVLAAAGGRPVSFEVFADDFPGMIEEARAIAAWSSNAVVKIPVTDTKGRFTGEVLRELSSEGIAINVTAVFTFKQVRAIAATLDRATPAIVSVFAGRVADTGIDPVAHMRACKTLLGNRPKAQLLWASTRELLNVFHAEESGCDIVTVPPEILDKADLVDKDLAEYSLETVQMFHRNATAAFHV